MPTIYADFLEIQRLTNCPARRWSRARRRYALCPQPDFGQRHAHPWNDPDRGGTPLTVHLRTAPEATLDQNRATAFGRESRGLPSTGDGGIMRSWRCWSPYEAFSKKCGIGLRSALHSNASRCRSPYAANVGASSHALPSRSGCNGFMSAKKQQETVFRSDRPTISRQESAALVGLERERWKR